MAVDCKKEWKDRVCDVVWMGEKMARWKLSVGGVDKV